MWNQGGAPVPTEQQQQQQSQQWQQWQQYYQAQNAAGQQQWPGQQQQQQQQQQMQQYMQQYPGQMANPAAVQYGMMAVGQQWPAQQQQQQPQQWQYPGQPPVPSAGQGVSQVPAAGAPPLPTEPAPPLPAEPPPPEPPAPSSLDGQSTSTTSNGAAAASAAMTVPSAVTSAIPETPAVSAVAAPAAAPTPAVSQVAASQAPGAAGSTAAPMPVPTAPQAQVAPQHGSQPPYQTAAPAYGHQYPPQAQQPFQHLHQATQAAQVGAPVTQSPLQTPQPYAHQQPVTGLQQQSWQQSQTTHQPMVHHQQPSHPGGQSLAPPDTRHHPPGAPSLLGQRPMTQATQPGPPAHAVDRQPQALLPSPARPIGAVAPVQQTLADSNSSRQADTHHPYGTGSPGQLGLGHGAQQVTSSSNSPRLPGRQNVPPPVKSDLLSTRTIEPHHGPSAGNELAAGKPVDFEKGNVDADREWPGAQASSKWKSIETASEQPLWPETTKPAVDWARNTSAEQPQWPARQEEEPPWPTRDESIWKEAVGVHPASENPPAVDEQFVSHAPHPARDAPDSSNRASNEWALGAQHEYDRSPRGREHEDKPKRDSGRWDRPAEEHGRDWQRPYEQYGDTASPVRGGVHPDPAPYHDGGEGERHAKEYDYQDAARGADYKTSDHHREHQDAHSEEYDGHHSSRQPAYGSDPPSAEHPVPYQARGDSRHAERRPADPYTGQHQPDHRRGEPEDYERPRGDPYGRQPYADAAGGAFDGGVGSEGRQHADTAHPPEARPGDDWRQAWHSSAQHSEPPPHGDRHHYDTPAADPHADWRHGHDARPAAAAEYHQAEPAAMDVESAAGEYAGRGYEASGYGGAYGAGADTAGGDANHQHWHAGQYGEESWPPAGGGQSAYDGQQAGMHHQQQQQYDSWSQYNRADQGYGAFAAGDSAYGQHGGTGTMPGMAQDILKAAGIDQAASKPKGALPSWLRSSLEQVLAKKKDSGGGKDDDDDEEGEAGEDEEHSDSDRSVEQQRRSPSPAPQVLKPTGKSVYPSEERIRALNARSEASGAESVEGEESDGDGGGGLSVQERMRRMMTDVLLGATDDGIQFVSKEVHSEALLQRQRVMTQATPDVLGLLGYSSDSDSDDARPTGVHGAAKKRPVLTDGYGMPVLSESGTSRSPTPPPLPPVSVPASSSSFADPDLDGTALDDEALDGAPLDDGRDAYANSTTAPAYGASDGKVMSGSAGDLAYPHLAATEEHELARGSSQHQQEAEHSPSRDSSERHRHKHSHRRRERDYSPRHGDDRSPKRHHKHSHRRSSSSSRSKKRRHRDRDSRSRSRSPSSHRHRHSSRYR